MQELLGAFAASTTDANRTIEALREGVPGAAPGRRSRGASSRRTRKWSGLAFADGGERAAPTCSARPRCSRRRSPRRRRHGWHDASRRSGRRRGLRVVLFAGRPRAASPSASGDAPPELPAGLRGARPRLLQRRAAARRAAHAATSSAEAGIEVKIISGDNPRTVRGAGHAGRRARPAPRLRASTPTAKPPWRPTTPARRPSAAPAAAEAALDARRPSPSRAPTSRACRRRSSPRPRTQTTHLRPRHAGAEAGPRARPCATAAATWR